MEQTVSKAGEPRLECSAGRLHEIRAIIEHVRMDHAKALLLMDGLDNLMDRVDNGEPVPSDEFRNDMRALKDLLDHEVIEHFGFEETKLFPLLRQYREELDVSLPIMRQITREHDGFADCRAEFNLALEALEEAGDDAAAYRAIVPHVRSVCRFLRVHVELEDSLVGPATAALEQMAA